MSAQRGHDEVKMEARDLAIRRMAIRPVWRHDQLMADRVMAAGNERDARTREMASQTIVTGDGKSRQGSNARL